MSCYVLTMNNCREVCEVSNKVFYLMFPQFQTIQDTSVCFTINKIIQGCVGKVYGFKSSDMVLTSIYCGSAHDVVLNPTLNFFFYHHSLCL